MDLFGEKKKALVIQLILWVNTLCEVETDNIAMAELELNLSEYFDHSRHPKDYVDVMAHLTGYITRIAYPSTSDGETRGHYVSVTKNIETGDFYLSGDLYPQRPKRLGPRPNLTWPKP